MSILKKIRNSKGFTLVELLVVIAIIGVLATLILLQLGTARAKARDAKRISDVSQLRVAIEIFFDDNNGDYPVGPLCPATVGEVCTNYSATNSGNNLTSYFAVRALPRDPLTNSVYSYAWNNDGNFPAQFHLWADLERRNAPATTADADVNSTGWAGGGIANQINGGVENATTCTAANDCIYDVGQQ